MEFSLKLWILLFTLPPVSQWRYDESLRSARSHISTKKAGGKLNPLTICLGQSPLSQSHRADRWKTLLQLPSTPLCKSKITLFRYYWLSSEFYCRRFCSQGMCFTLQCTPMFARNTVQPRLLRSCCTLVRTGTFTKLKKGLCMTTGLTLLIDFFTQCDSTVRLPGIVHKNDVLSSISALACVCLLCCELERTQVVCLTVIYQCFNLCCYYCAPPKQPTGVDTTCYPNFLCVLYWQTDYNCR